MTGITHHWKICLSYFTWKPCSWSFYHSISGCFHGFPPAAICFLPALTIPCNSSNLIECSIQIERLQNLIFTTIKPWTVIGRCRKTFITDFKHPLTCFLIPAVFDPLFQSSFPPICSIILPICPWNSTVDCFSSYIICRFDVNGLWDFLPIQIGTLNRYSLASSVFCPLFFGSIHKCIM